MSFRHLDVQTNVWEDVFDKLAKSDGEDDGKIDRKALVKWLSAMDLQHRIDLEKNLDVSPNQIERIVKQVNF